MCSSPCDDRETPPSLSDSVGFANRCTHYNIIRSYKKINSSELSKSGSRQLTGNPRTTTSLYDQGTFKVDRRVLADVFDTPAYIFIEWINSEAVLFGVDDLDETAPE